MTEHVLLSSSAALHDHLAGKPGSHAAALAALGEARSHAVRTDVGRANVRDLAALAQWLVARRDRVAHWRLRWSAEPRRPGLAPSRLGVVAPYMLHAATWARSHGLRAHVSGLPTCLLGPHADLRDPSAPKPAAAFPPVCSGCGARADCAGVAPSYATRFAADLELRPVGA